MSTYSGSLARLGQLAATMRRLGDVPSRAAPAVATELARLIDQQFSAGTDPYGKAWAALLPQTVQRKGGDKRILIRTGDMRSAVSVRPAAGGGVVITIGPYAGFHQEGTKHMARRMLLPGGTFQYVISAISDDLVARLAAKSYNPLVVQSGSSRVLFGREYTVENVAPPRVVVVPKGGPFSARSAANSSTTQVGTKDNRNAATVQRPLWSRNAGAEVHCWGADYADAEFLGDQFIVSMQLVIPGCFRLGSGYWVEDINIVVRGQTWVFTFTCDIPVFDDTVDRAPTDTTVTHEGYIELPDGSSEQGC